MTRTLFFADKSVLFAGELPVGGSCDVILEKGTAVSRAKILKILETNNSVAILSDDPEGLFSALPRSSFRSRLRAALR